ncbi:MAG: head GIN domain-containing protein [Saprospiraceae bacterium]
MQNLRFLGFLIVGMVALNMQSCFIDLDDNDNIFGCEKGTGDVVTEEIILPAFHSIDLSGADNVFLSQGPEQKIEVEGQANMIDLLNRDVSGGTWRIDFEDCVGSHRDLKIFITIPEIRAISITGSGDVFGENEFTVGDLELRTTGSGDMDLAVNADDIDLRITGSGDTRHEGICDDLRINLTGSGDYDGFNMEALSANVSITGSGDCEVRAVDNLDVRITGSGDVYYRGNPFINVNITGSGSLINAN